MQLPANHTTFFNQPAWWQTMAPGYATLVFESASCRVAFPYHITHKAGVRFLRNPHLTPYCLPTWQGEATVEQKKKLLEAAVQQLPSCQVVEWHWHPACGVVDVPGFTTEQHHTRVLPLQAIDALWLHCKPSLQRQIKKATKRLHIASCWDASVLYELQATSLARHKKSNLLPLEEMVHAVAFLQEHGGGHILTASLEGRPVAAVLVVWDAHTTYYLGGGTTREGQTHGAMSYLLWHAIGEAVTRGNSEFDFEGSRHEGIDRFFSLFGAEKRYYSVLVKNTSWLHRLYRWFRAKR